MGTEGPKLTGRMKKPPPTPEAQLQRILRIAKLDGVSLVVIAGISILFSLGDWFGMAVCVTIVGGGWMELSGRKQLLAGDATGIRRMVKAQLLVLAAIEILCVVNLKQGMSPEVREAIAGLDMPELEPAFRSAFTATYIAVALLTVVYQGGMARYYGKKAGVVRTALADRARPPAPAAGWSSTAPEDEVT